MISAEEFIDILEQKDLLDPDLVQDLRRRIEQSMAPVSAALLAKRLVDKGHLSRKLAQRLLDRAEADVDEPAPPPAPLEEPALEEPDVANLGLAPLEEDEEDEAVEEEVNLESTEEEDWGLQELEEDQPAAPPIAAIPAAPTPPAAPVPTATPIPPAAPVPPAGDSLVEGLEEIEEIEELGGPLGGLEEAALTGEPIEGVLDGAGSKRRRKGRKVKGEKGNVWDSSLLLIGGGALLLLVIVMVALAWVLFGRSADDMLAEANKNYGEAAYTKAEDLYSQFLEKYPKHSEAGFVRVRLSLVKMRQAMSGDWPAAFEVAKTQIPLMSGEEAFATEARPELASMLPDIAEGLAKKGHSDQDGEMANLAEEAMALVEKYVPNSSRPHERLQEITGLIALTRREIARTERLEATTAEMAKAAEEGRTQEGYALRRALLKDYQVLYNDPTLADAVRIVSTAEQAAVKKMDKPVSAVTAEPESEALATIGLAQRAVKKPLSGVGEERIFAVAGGAVYGLAATDGKVLWRRDVGFEKNVRGPQFPPTPISDRPGADPLLVSRSRQEVLRVEASTGKIRWRFPLGEAFDAHPVVFDGRVFVATLSGRLVVLDLETGNSSEFIEFPQPLRVGPVADSTRGVLYQVGEHSSLFVLSASDFSCQDVFYLGHEPGAIVVPPVRVSRYLLVCENDDIRDSSLKVLDVDSAASEEGAPPLKLVQKIPLKGHIHTAPIVNGAQVLLVTDAGAITLLRVTGGEGKEPLSVSASGTTAGESRAELVRYASLSSGRLWIADSQLTQYAVRSSESRLTPSWVANERSVSLQTPMVAGEAVVQVRQRQSMPGVVVSAHSMRSDGDVLWETTLASPAAGTPIVDGVTRTLIATTAVGGVFQIQPPDPGTVSLRDDPNGAIPSGELTAPVEQVLYFSDGTLALIPGKNPVNLRVFEPGGSAGATRLRSLVLPSPLSGDAIVFADALLAPTEAGQVHWLKARGGEKVADPFQPPLEAGRKYRWCRPAAVGDDQFVIADDQGGLYRVAVKATPEKHLAAETAIQLADPLTSPIAVLENQVYGVDRRDSLVRVNWPDLTEKKLQPLGAKCVLGPVTIGDYVLLATNDDLLHVIDASGKMRSDPLPSGIPLAEPLVDGSNWLFAAAAGTVWQVEASTGKEQARVDTGLALGSGLALFGTRLLVAGHDGTFYLIDKP